MPDEFDPTVELGLPPDRYVVCTCRGFLTKNDDMRQLCGRFIEKGEVLYDVLNRYDRLTAYVLNREDATAGSHYKWCIPFLKAYGATDHLLHRYSAEDLVMMPHASRTMNYISGILPTHITTTILEHGMMEVSEKLNAPLCEVSESKLCIDQTMMGRSEARNLKDLCKEITKLKVPKNFYELNVPTELLEEDITIIKTLDAIIGGGIPESGALGLMESADIMTSHKKAYRLLDIRRLSMIDLDCTMYVGSSATDFQPMDLVREAGGLSISFNGEEFAVRGSNVAIISDDTTVVSIFASVFNDKGVLASYDLAANWSRKYLEEMDFPDRNLLNTFLREHPKDLPEVYAVNDGNVDEISKKSEKYRKKILGK